MGINTADYVHQSLSNSDSCYSILRLTDTTPSQYAHMMLSSDAQRHSVPPVCFIRMIGVKVVRTFVFLLYTH